MIELTGDAARFARAAGPLLQGRIENTILATVLQSIQVGRHADPPPRFAIVTDAAGEVVGAALRTPPWPLIATELTAEDAHALMARWLTEDPELPGLNAQTETSRALVAAAAVQITGVTARLRTRQALHVLDPGELRPPSRPAPGRLSPATPAEIDVCLAWEDDFAREAGVEGDSKGVRDNARARLVDGRTYLWEADSVAGPVSLVGHTPMIAGVPRIGPVYTPPAHREHGYASAAVHALSARLLSADARRIVLFTDLANPTSNRIYADVGYRRVGDWEIHRLIRTAVAQA